MRNIKDIINFVDTIPDMLGRLFMPVDRVDFVSDIKTIISQWREYKDLEEQGKLLVLAYEICVVSECNYCNHVERRIEETWIRPELLNHDGFYKTKEAAEAALKEMSE